jgi:competence protein ComEA
MAELKKVQAAAFYAAVVIAASFSVWFVLNGFAANAQPGAVKLESRINPNTAPAASLARLPGIGITKANAIVEYRQRFQSEGRSEPAFRDCKDLDNVKGIGPVTVNNLCKELKFGAD